MSIKLTKVIPNLPKFMDEKYLQRFSDGTCVAKAEAAVAYDIHDTVELYAVFADYQGMQSVWCGRNVKCISALIMNGRSVYVVTFDVPDRKNFYSGFLTCGELIKGYKQFRTEQVWDEDTHESECQFGL